MDEGKARLSRDDWSRAALFAWAEGGPGALSVEGLARQLGVTKGSFYWHFKNRGALLRAAVEMWRDRGTAQVISTLEQDRDPRERLRQLFAIALNDLPGLRVEAALIAASAAAHPVIAPVFAEVNAQRLGYLQQLYREIGAPNPEHRGRVAYAAYLGAVQLASMQPPSLVEEQIPGLLDAIEATLMV